MNPLIGKSYPENRQHAPEQRRLSKDATEIFLNTVRPLNYTAAENLKRIVKSMVPEHFVQPQVAPRTQVTPQETYQFTQPVQLAAAESDSVAAELARIARENINLSFTNGEERVDA